MHEGIAHFNAMMANLPYQMGYSPKSWQVGINAMLLKKQDDFRVSKLQAILLYEADFNHNNKHIGKRHDVFHGRFEKYCTGTIR